MTRGRVIDLGDLTKLIDYLFTTSTEPVCMAEANIDGDSAGVVDLGDLTALIAYLFIVPHPVPAACPGEQHPYAPVIDGMADQVIMEGASFSALMLDDYVTDADHVDNEMIWSYSAPEDLVVMIGNRVCYVMYSGSGWPRHESVVFRATDPHGLWDEDTVSFTVLPSYTPLDSSDWRISDPVDQGLDPELVYETYQYADTIPHLYSLLIVRNGFLIAEMYFNYKDINDANSTASATKCYISALTGIALQQGHLTSLDQKMVDFFPEFAWVVDDPRKRDITLRQLLQMRSGYPWEERYPVYLNMIASTNNWIDLMDDFPLMSDPGAEFGYSNLTAHIMAVILGRATNSLLENFAQDHLFDFLGYTHGFWPRDAVGYNVGHGDMRIRPRDMAKFGQLILQDGMFDSVQVIPSDWVDESTQAYSTNIFGGQITEYFLDIDYGYFWPKAQVGSHAVTYAWGHGGQLIVIVDDLQMVVVTTADDLHGIWDAWHLERSVIDLVGRYIATIE